MHVRVSASAPGKITLFGEHAVVYGKPAIVMAINRRVWVHIAKRDDNRLVIDLPDISVRGVRLVVQPTGESFVEASPTKEIGNYIVQALKTASERFGGHYMGLNVKVESNMPVGAGLGTSAAIAVATLAAYAALEKANASRQELARLGREVEVSVQGSSSGMDVAIAVYGGVKLYRPTQQGFQLEDLQLGGNPAWAAGYTERLTPTAESVRKVGQLASKHTLIVGKIIDTIGEIVLEARGAIEEGDWRRAGQLMNINHGLLSALGISTHHIERIVYAARGAGALGAKLTGGGMGGSVVALCEHESLGRVVSSITHSGYTSFEVSPETEGIKLEEG